MLKIGAESIVRWYFETMKKHFYETQRESDPISEKAAAVAEVMAERSYMTKEFLKALAHAVAANEEAQRRFRTAVVIRLSRIETTVKMIHGAQIVESQRWEPRFEEKIRERAEASEEYISQKSDELGLAMVKYIYGEPEALDPQPKTRRKRSDSLSTRSEKRSTTRGDCAEMPGEVVEFANGVFGALPALRARGSGRVSFMNSMSPPQRADIRLKLTRHRCQFG